MITHAKGSAVITIYSKDGCRACLATKRQFNKAGVPFTEINLSRTPQVAQALTDAGYTQLPVVIANAHGIETSWSGFRPENIKQTLASLKLHTPQQTSRTDISTLIKGRVATRQSANLVGERHIQATRAKAAMR